MPYKDLERKKAWEQTHRTRRLARRRELRRLEEAAQPIHQSVSNPIGASIGPLWMPMLAVVGIAAYRPKLALGAGGLTLFAAMYYPKGWQWWLIGLLTVLLALLFLNWNSVPNDEKK